MKARLANNSEIVAIKINCDNSNEFLRVGRLLNSGKRVLELVFDDNELVGKEDLYFYLKPYHHNYFLFHF